MLAPDVVLTADGGGVAQAMPRPVVGARKVANLLRAFPKFGAGSTIVPVTLNGAPGCRIVGLEDGHDTAIAFAVEEGRIAAIYSVRNPYELGGIDAETSLSR